MTARLAGLDTAFVCLDTPATPMQLGAVLLFSPRGETNPVRLLRERAGRISELRQRIQRRWPTGELSWSEDSGFDVDRHLAVHQLRGRGDQAQLNARVAEIMAEPLPMRRPPWQLHVITGLRGGRFAVVAKMHHALADGARAILLGLGLFDGCQPPPVAAAPEPVPAAADSVDEPRPSLRRALGDAVGGLPAAARDTRSLLGLTGDVLRKTRLAPTPSPLFAAPSEHRQLGTLRLDQAELARVRRLHGGTLNDLLLALFTGALRHWLLDRGESVGHLRPRALVPVSQRNRDATRGDGANRLSGYLCDLPIAEPDPAVAHGVIRASMDHNKRIGPRRGAGALPVLADRIPALLHRVATPVLGQFAGLLFDLVATSVALPPVPLHLGGASLQEVYPVVPLAPGHALGVAFCTYRGGVHIGLHVNHQAIPDVGRLAAMFPVALAELGGDPASLTVPDPRHELRDPAAGRAPALSM